MVKFLISPLSLRDKIARSNFRQPEVTRRVSYRDVANQRVRVRAFKKIRLTQCFINLVLLTLLMISTPAYSTDTFAIKLNEASIELGKPVWITLQTTLTKPSLNEVDFSVLDEQFEVIKDKNAIRYTEQGQSWRIRLYPRNKGIFSIAPLSFAANTSKLLKVQVHNPTDSKTGQAFDVEYQPGKASAWVRQQVLVTYKLQSRESTLLLAPQQKEIRHILLVPLASAIQPQADKFIHTSGWAVFPRQQGKKVFKLPALHYIRDGVVTHRFYPPRIHLDVKGLPDYLPGNIPVGKLSFKPISQPAFVLRNSLDNIALALSGAGIPQQWLPDIRHMFIVSKR